MITQLHNFRKKSPREKAATLVVTLLVMVLLSTITVAFMQAVSSERAAARSVANRYQAELAAQAGIHHAMGLIRQTITNFNYVSGSDISISPYRTYVRPTSIGTGNLIFSGNATFLDSGTSGDLTELLVSGTNSSDGIIVRTSWTNFLSTNQTTNRYAFWVDEAGAKQNLNRWAATNNINYPWGSGTLSRSLMTNIAGLSLVLPSANGTTVSAFPTAALSALNSFRTFSATNETNFLGLGLTNTIVTATNPLLTPSTLNLTDPALQSRVSSYFFTLSSNPSSAVSPGGRRKLNLQHLASYLNNSGLSTQQGSGFPRAILVDQLLTSNPPEQTNWGGGDLNWLATSGRYSLPERRQIVANLIDYLDSDLIPTTDSIDSPTYFGVEMRADSSGRIIGHPYINFITTGMIFNRQPSTGQVNSTRVLCSLGLVFPWTSTGVSANAYTPEINIAVEGTVLNGMLGNQAGPYFRTNDLSDQISSRPVSVFTPHSGNNWPEAVGLAGSASYATPFFGHTTGNWPARGPTNLTFQNARHVIRKLRLQFTSTSPGQTNYAQILPTNMVINVFPTNLVVGGTSPTALLVKFSEGGVYSNTPNLYLNDDPRASFKRNSWTNLSSQTSFGTNIPPPSSGVNAINLANNILPAEWDQAQGLPMNFSWYTSANSTNHLGRPREAAATNSALFSIGELGYLWSGRSWQTLSMSSTNNPSTADWNLLDYISSGFTTNSTNHYSTIPIVPPKQLGPGITLSNGLMQEGGFNILTRKRATIAAYLTNTTNLAPSAVNDFTSSPASTSPSIGGAIAAMSSLSADTTTKFGRESVARALANGAVNQSRAFTIYSKGEYLTGQQRVSVFLEADIFIGVNAQSGNPEVQIITMREK